MDIKVIKEKISLDELEKIAKEGFGDMVKAVVDVEQKIMSIGGSMHADEEALMLEQGAKQENLWGINIYPGMPADQRIEFDSMINLRAWQGNRSRDVQDANVRSKIIKIVAGLTE